MACEKLHHLIEKKDFSEFLRESTTNKTSFYNYKSEVVSRYTATK